MATNKRSTEIETAKWTKPNSEMIQGGSHNDSIEMGMISLAQCSLRREGSSDSKGAFRDECQAVSFSPMTQRD